MSTKVEAHEQSVCNFKTWGALAHIDAASTLKFISTILLNFTSYFVFHENLDLTKLRTSLSQLNSGWVEITTNKFSHSFYESVKSIFLIFLILRSTNRWNSLCILILFDQTNNNQQIDCNNEVCSQLSARWRTTKLFVAVYFLKSLTRRRKKNRKKNYSTKIKLERRRESKIVGTMNDSLRGPSETIRRIRKLYPDLVFFQTDSSPQITRVSNDGKI